MNTATTSRPSARDIAPGDFEFVRRFVKDRSAISLEDGKEYLVTSRFAPLVRTHGFADLEELVAHLRQRPHGDLAEDVIDAMTTNETSFFRDVHPFESLRDHIVPALYRQREPGRQLRIWCAASSSGQEPYSIAMTLREHHPELDHWDVRIVATDISKSMLEKASKGEYSQLEVNRGLPAPLLVKHFRRRGARWRLSEDIRSMVEFTALNLATRWLTLGRFDVIFMRNVLIYFDTDTKSRILTQAREHLAPDGYLILGGAETTVGVDNEFRRVLHGRSVWYRAT